MATVTGTLTMTNNRPPEGFDPAGYAWKAQLRYKGRRLTVPFYTGSMAGEPTPADVIECLISDATSVENASDFYDWCAELGMEPSREAEKAYRQCEQIARKVHQFLADDFDQIAYAS